MSTPGTRPYCDRCHRDVDPAGEDTATAEGGLIFCDDACAADYFLHPRPGPRTICPVHLIADCSPLLNGCSRLAARKGSSEFPHREGQS